MSKSVTAVHAQTILMESVFETAYGNLLRDVVSAASMEAALHCRKSHKNIKKKEVIAKVKPRDCVKVAEHVLNACRKKRRLLKVKVDEDLSDLQLSRAAPFTDKFNLRPYERVLHLVPRLVNCVTLAEAIPLQGVEALPLDLHRIAAFCKNSYYAPRKFSAVQLAYAEPRCRVLVFRVALYSNKACQSGFVHPDCRCTDTGRLVGTGCSSPTAARLALMRAQRQIYKDAGIYIQLRNFAVRLLKACRLQPLRLRLVFLCSGDQSGRRLQHGCHAQLRGVCRRAHFQRALRRQVIRRACCEL